ncbi:MAG: exo-alpha-sialidase, partial [Clostridia bacterium]|nr:exo-alpha-sialidase [Clostridia bacterium]
AWRYDGCSWQSMGLVAEDFWPLGAPARTADGNWLIPGCDGKWLAAAAISHGGDLTKWDVIRPDTNGEIFTEAGAWVDGRRVMLVMRNQSARTDGRFHAAVSLSEDGGRTFSPAALSNLPMCTTKPFCGYLADGRPYLVFNESIPGRPYDRSRMLLGVGEKGSFRIDRLYLIDEGQPTDGNRRLMLSYPYARQIGDKLYIAYSSESAPGRDANNNDAMLAVVDVNSLN